MVYVSVHIDFSLLNAITKQDVFSLPRIDGSEAALNQPKTKYQVDLDDYKQEPTDSLTQAWKLASSDKKAEKHQNIYYDRHAKTLRYCVGDHVFVYMSSA